MVKKIILLVTVIVTFVLFSFKKQTNDSNLTIIWSINEKLTWDDFLGTPPQKSKFAAMSSLDMKYNAYTKKDTLFYLLTNKFFRISSWVYPQSKKVRLLDHEQTHFDILELYCRKLRQHISKISIKKTEYKKLITDAYKNYWREYKTCDSLYDQETNFSNDVPIQNKWTTRINQEIKNLEIYKDTIIVKLFTK